MKEGVSNKMLSTTTAENAHPDGSTVDAQCCLWSDLWGAGKIARHSPFVELLLHLEVPVTQPYSVAIGGLAMDWLFVTSSNWGWIKVNLLRKVMPVMCLSISWKD